MVCCWLKREKNGRWRVEREKKKQFMLSIIVFSAWVNCKNHFCNAFVVAFCSFAFSWSLFLFHSHLLVCESALLFCYSDASWLISVWQMGHVCMYVSACACVCVTGLEWVCETIHMNVCKITFETFSNSLSQFLIAYIRSSVFLCVQRASCLSFPLFSHSHCAIDVYFSDNIIHLNVRYHHRNEKFLARFILFDSIRVRIYTEIMTV